MSQYQRLRVASKPTGWPATSTATVDSSMVSDPLASWAVLSGKQDGVGWPGSEIAVLCSGSKPHSVTYGAIELGGSTGELLFWCQHTTPSRSPSPDDHHGRSR